MNVRERLPEYIYPPKIYRNFWSESVLAELQTLINDFYNDKLLLRLQYTFWAKNLWKDSAPILAYDLNNPDLINQIGKELNDIYPLEETLENDWDVSCILTFGMRGSFIPFHSDKGYKLASTTYLNHDWELNWGGFFLYEDYDGIIHAEHPEYNKMIILAADNRKIKEPLNHGTTITSQGAKVRISLQIFFSQGTR